MARRSIRFAQGKISIALLSSLLLSFLQLSHASCAVTSTRLFEIRTEVSTKPQTHETAPPITRANVKLGQFDTNPLIRDEDFGYTCSIIEVPASVITGIKNAYGVVNIGNVAILQINNNDQPIYLIGFRTSANKDYTQLYVGNKKIAGTGDIIDGEQIVTPFFVGANANGQVMYMKDMPNNGRLPNAVFIDQKKWADTFPTELDNNYGGPYLGDDSKPYFLTHNVILNGKKKPGSQPGTTLYFSNDLVTWSDTATVQLPRNINIPYLTPSYNKPFPWSTNAAANYSVIRSSPVYDMVPSFPFKNKHHRHIITPYIEDLIRHNHPAGIERKIYSDFFGQASLMEVDGELYGPDGLIMVEAFGILDSTKRHLPPTYPSHYDEGYAYVIAPNMLLYGKSTTSTKFPTLVAFVDSDDNHETVNFIARNINSRGEILLYFRTFLGDNPVWIVATPRKAGTLPVDPKFSSVLLPSFKIDTPEANK